MPSGSPIEIMYGDNGYSIPYYSMRRIGTTTTEAMLAGSDRPELSAVVAAAGAAVDYDALGQAIEEAAF